MIADGVLRDATVEAQIDWPLQPDTEYRRPNGAIMGTTNADGVFDFPITSGINGGVFAVGWTGLNADWTAAANNCNGWSASSGFTGAYGNANGDSTSAMIHRPTQGNGDSCAPGNDRLVCAGPVLTGRTCTLQ